MPKSLADLHHGLIQIKREIRELSLSSDERDVVCTRLLCDDWDQRTPTGGKLSRRSSFSEGGRALLRSLTSGADSSVRVEVANGMARKMRIFAEHLRAHLGEDVFDENMQDGEWSRVALLSSHVHPRLTPPPLPIPSSDRGGGEAVRHVPM